MTHFEISEKHVKLVLLRDHTNVSNHALNKLVSKMHVFEVVDSFIQVGPVFIIIMFVCVLFQLEICPSQLITRWLVFR